ncbi:MAG: RNA repair transcriptional activator RtcR [Candidatus Cloacimonetes bacterium]|nr:RNA repair transcriptional activator RtcR [Candidatus Cloacimonadota bacterium]
MKKKVSIGFLGTTLDKGQNPHRWEKWRPTIDLHSFDDLVFDRFELLYDQRYSKLCDVIYKDVQQISPETLVNKHLLPIASPWDFEDVFSTLYDFSKAYPFDPDNEEYYFHITTGTHVVQICLFLLTESRNLPGTLIQVHPNWKRGKMVSEPSYSIIDLDLSKYDPLISRFHKQSIEATSFLKSGIETKNKAFNNLIDEIEKVSIYSKHPLLLMGPTGAGKSLLAKRIFELKKKRHKVSGELVQINCATIRSDTASSTLFGHKRGSFTGAITDRVGLIKAAHKGILFLDEISELGLQEQAMLLHALEEKTFYPLGSDKQESSDFQIIAGTNIDLEHLVSLGLFRKDLLARINMWTFQLPGLVDRKEDISANINFELDQFEKSENRRVTFNKEAINKYLKFALSKQATWKASFRDLNSSIIRMATLAQNSRINTQNVEQEIQRLIKSWNPANHNNLLSTLLTKDQLEKIDLFDQLQLQSILKVCSQCDSLAQAGKELFAVTRNSKSTNNDSDRIRKYLAKFGLNWKQIKDVY